MTACKIHRKYQWITLTLSTLNLVLAQKFYFTVDEVTAICKLGLLLKGSHLRIPYPLTQKLETHETKFLP